MAKTIDIILDKALELFNKNGVLQTSTRDIADAAGISQGNLTYHFRQRNEIIVSLFYKLKMEMDTVIEQLTVAPFSPDNFKKQLKMKFQLFYKYRFLFLDFLNILREVKELHKAYAELNKQRNQELHGIVDGFAKTGLLKQKLSVDERNSLYTMFTIYFNFWLTDAEILYKGKKNIVSHYEAVALKILKPYLNEKGRKALGLAR